MFNIDNVFKKSYFVCETFHKWLSMNTISQPTVNRLCALYQILTEMARSGDTVVSSSTLGEKVGIGSHNVRKDISYLGGIGNYGSGYNITKLRDAIAARFGFNEKKCACIVGLGRIGGALLQHAQNSQEEIKIIAGFDSNINKLETIKTTISVYPAYQITEIVKKMGIVLGIIAVPESAAQDSASRLIDGGVKGIINFTAAHIKVNMENVFVKNVDITSELLVLSALINIQY